MNNLSLIAAIGKNNELGLNNKLIWHLPEDLLYFKEKTLNKTIIMGRLTFESLPGVLPKRKHIVLTKNKEYKKDGVIIYNDISECLDYIESSGEECFIIGGYHIYKEFLKYVNTLYLTEIDESFEADTYFPKFNKKLYNKTIIKESSHNGINYKFVKYEKQV